MDLTTVLWGLLGRRSHFQLTAGDADRSDAAENARVAYQVAAAGIDTTSREAYSRFTGMLTLHGLLFATIGFVADRVVQRSDMWRLVFFFVPVPIVGLFLCAIWWGLVSHSVAAQEVFRRKARDVERLFNEELRIYTNLEDSRMNRPAVNFNRGSKLIIGGLALVYLYLLIVLLALACNPGWFGLQQSPLGVPRP